MSAITPLRRMTAVFIALVAVLAAGSLIGALGRVTAAQEATPEATPLATGGVPCTTLFGIQNPEAACALFVNASPDSPFLDLYIDGTLALPGVEYGILGDFIEVPSGEHQIQFTAAGDVPANAVIDEVVQFEPGFAYEAAAIGLAADIQLLTRAVNTTPLLNSRSTPQIAEASACPPRRRADALIVFRVARSTADARPDRCRFLDTYARIVR